MRRRRLAVRHLCGNVSETEPARVNGTGMVASGWADSVSRICHITRVAVALGSPRCVSFVSFATPGILADHLQPGFTPEGEMT